MSRAHTHLPAPRRRRRGLTLIELIVGVFISLTLTAAAVVFASHETKLLGYSSEQIDSQQSIRAAIDLMTGDIQSAGTGLGYLPSGEFAGLQIGSFTVPGGLQFNPNGVAGANVTLRPGDVTTGAERSSNTYVLASRDLGLLLADGPIATIAQQNGAAGEICDAANAIPAAQQMALFKGSDGLSVLPVLITLTGNAGACTFGQCLGAGGAAGTGCRPFTFVTDPNPVFAIPAGMANLSYLQGSAHTGFKEVVWFVNQAAAPNDATASLRRAVFDGRAGATCAAGSRANCGAEVAPWVETMQYRVWQWNSAGAGAWAQVNPPGPVNTRNRLRVDVELVTRARVSDGRPHDGIALRLAPGQCVPNTACPPTAASRDNIPRRAYRWSVHVRNSKDPS
ncbi:prepilin-type N-terminal cleavage/methylation domain-containing protein [Myxococcota bacterium]|nr:prepilin-type N-terminal cleavage/methylation domain-containing protein [Myxococcota bacterium]